MDVDQVVNQLGGFGRYQIFITSLAYFSALFSSQPGMQDSFINYTPKHRCFVPSCDTNNSSYKEDFLNYTTEYEEEDEYWSRCKYYEMTANATDSPDALWSSTGGTVTGHGKLTASVREFLSRSPRNIFQQLHISSPLLSSSLLTNAEFRGTGKLMGEANCSAENFNENTKVKCTKGWVYDDSQFKSTTAMEFDLVCSRAYLTALTTTVYNIGQMIGSIFIGIISDKYGRKMGYCVSLTFLIVGGLGVVCAVNPAMLIVARGVSGVGMGIYQCSFILLAEFTPNEHRTKVGLIVGVMFALGEALIGVYAIFIRRWRALKLAILAPSLILVIYCWLMPESIRWLASKGKYAEAKAVVHKIARVNKIDPPDCSFFDDAAQQTAQDAPKSRSFLDLLKFPVMRKRTLNIFFTWFAVNFAYYGVSQNAVNLGGNIYVNFIGMMVIEIPACGFATFIFDRIGHRSSLALSLVITGLACTVSGLIPADISTIIVVLSLIGKFGCAAAFTTLNVYSSEIFPTDCRSSGMGASAMFASLGGALSPMVAQMGKVYPPLPLLVVGVVISMSLVSVLFLPETAGSALANTLEESEAFGNDQSMWEGLCCKRRTNKQDDKAARGQNNGSKSVIKT